MILLTADRPARLRGMGSNQTTEQVGIFADAVRACIDVSVPEMGEHDPSALALEAYSLAMGMQSTASGPVQLNLQFQEPLSSAEPNSAELFAALDSTTPQHIADPLSQLTVSVDDQTVVIGGAGAGESAVKFAEAANLPLFAEPTSGARFGSCASEQYLALLETDLGKAINRVIVFGKPTLSRSVLKLIARCETFVAKSPTHGHFDPFQNSLGFADVIIPVGTGSADWVAAWQQKPASSNSRRELASLIWNATEPGEQLLFGASQIIREAEQVLPAKEILVYGNRGLAGIDGTVATAIGLAQTGRKTRALVGDLTLLHDASSLNLSGIEDINIQVIVGNDHGGEIFKKLEVASSVGPQQLARLFLTPQDVDFSALANAYGWEYFKVLDLADLEPLLKRSGKLLIDFQL
jgi:2-succinyl-5-enolpyruvyl-6-hydroxy-3-cyclohexene-1-carboxylate synthase